MASVRREWTRGGGRKFGITAMRPFWMVSYAVCGSSILAVYFK